MGWDRCGSVDRGSVVAGSPAVPLLLSCNPLGLGAAGRGGGSHSLPLGCVWAIAGVVLTPVIPSG